MLFQILSVRYSQEGDLVLVKVFCRRKQSDPQCEGPYTLMLTTPTSTEMEGRTTWIHNTHSKRVPHVGELKEPEATLILTLHWGESYNGGVFAIILKPREATNRSLKCERRKCLLQVGSLPPSCGDILNFCSCVSLYCVSRASFLLHIRR